MQVLNGIFKAKVDEGLLSLHHRCTNPMITHLCFADEKLVLFHGDVVSAAAVLDVLHHFHYVTGRQANVSKSKVFYSGESQSTKEDRSSILGFQLAGLPIKYLGLPLVSTRLKYVDCLPLSEKICNRIQSWKGRVLWTGRLELIKSVLNSIQVFWSNCFIFPKKMITAINQRCNTFLWSGPDMKKKIHHVSWSTICSPKAEGGLGSRNLEDCNISAI